jgi:hypothetical protein
MTTPMQNEERQTLRDHIIFLGTQLEAERKSNKEKTELLKRFLDRDDLGWAVNDEVRSLAYQILIDEAFRLKEIADHAN